MSFMLRLSSSLTGRKIGTDRFGNTYFEGKRKLPSAHTHKPSVRATQLAAGQAIACHARQLALLWAEATASAQG